MPDLVIALMIINRERHNQFFFMEYRLEVKEKRNTWQMMAMRAYTRGNFFRKNEEQQPCEAEELRHVTS